MQKVIEKADVLIEALPYIQRFRGDTVVVKFGGSAMEDPDCVENVLKDVAFMECVGLRPVLVHGGGKAISLRMKEAGLRPVFLKGLRVTDEDSIRIVEQVLNNEVNLQIVKELEFALLPLISGIEAKPGRCSETAGNDSSAAPSKSGKTSL